MRKYKIEVAMAILGVAFLIAIAIQFLTIASLVNIWWTIASDVTLIAIYMVATSVVLVTNTRRPRGIDPNVEQPLDPFSMTTDQLWREGMPDRRARQRRASDKQNAEVASRLIEHFEQQDDERPPPDATPEWARDLQQKHTDS